jgi:RHS repeat-associated protein
VKQAVVMQLFLQFLSLWLAFFLGIAGAAVPGAFNVDKDTLGRANFAGQTFDGTGNLTFRSAIGRVPASPDTLSPPATMNDPGQVLTWNALGQLSKATWANTQGNHVWNAEYDPLGRRIKQSWSINGVSQEDVATYFDPEVEFLELGAKEITSAGTLTHWKLHGLDLSGTYGGSQGMGGLVAVVQDVSGAVEYAINDVQGNTIGWFAGGSNSPSWRKAIVDAYGRPSNMAVRATDGGYVGNFYWHSRRMDPTGLYCLGARYYDAYARRFISPDPLGHGSDPTLYAYANFDPVNMIDADGRLATSQNYSLFGSPWLSKGDIASHVAQATFAYYGNPLDYQSTVNSAAIRQNYQSWAGTAAPWDTVGMEVNSYTYGKYGDQAPAPVLAYAQYGYNTGGVAGFNQNLRDGNTLLQIIGEQAGGMLFGMGVGKILGMGAKALMGTNTARSMMFGANLRYGNMVSIPGAFVAPSSQVVRMGMGSMSGVSASGSIFGSSSGATMAGGTSFITKTYAGSAVGFANEASLIGHFGKHGRSFGVNSAAEYLQLGRDIMTKGQMVSYPYKGEIRVGFAQFIGNGRDHISKFGFVGTNSSGNITTIHIESGNSFWKMVNGNKNDKTLKFK